jgi:hypothetical protein
MMARIARDSPGVLMIKHHHMLTVTSLLSILLMSIHLTGDIVRGIEKGGQNNLVGVLILVVWLSGALLLSERRTGFVILLLGAIFAAAMPVLHMRGSGVGGEFAKSSGAFLFIWTLYALGVTGTFSVILSVYGLVRTRSTEPR